MQASDTTVHWSSLLFKDVWETKRSARAHFALMDFQWNVSVHLNQRRQEPFRIKRMFVLSIIQVLNGEVPQLFVSGIIDGPQGGEGDRCGWIPVQSTVVI